MSISDYSDTLLQLITKKNNPNISMVDSIAELLNITYDAAYRRINRKVKLSFDEAIVLAKYYQINLNEVFASHDNGGFIVNDSKSVMTVYDFEKYLEGVYRELSNVLNKPDSHLLFATREIPMYYFFNDEDLIKIKIYLWFYLLKVTTVHKNIKYENFVITDKIIENSKKVGLIYDKLNTTEIWGIGALNNILMQLIYFNKLNLITLQETEVIVQKLKNAIQKIEEKTLADEINFQLYQNDIIINNNAIIIDVNGVKKFFYPYTLLKYFIISDQNICKEQENYLRDQLTFCTKISKTSIKNHALFFNDKYLKLEQALESISYNHHQKQYFI